jgi:hypothetical protein
VAGVPGPLRDGPFAASGAFLDAEMTSVPVLAPGGRVPAPAPEALVPR